MPNNSSKKEIAKQEDSLSDRASYGSNLTKAYGARPAPIYYLDRKNEWTAGEIEKKEGLERWEKVK